MKQPCSRLWCAIIGLITCVTVIDDSQTAEAETMETGDQPADTSVIEGDRYVVNDPYFGNQTCI